jgi:hypothetical protein
MLYKICARQPYDKFYFALVRAETEEQARGLAAGIGDPCEGSDWYSEMKANCTAIRRDGVDEVLIYFNEAKPAPRAI